MKKALIFYLVVLVGIFAALSLLDRDGEYAVEKRVWKLQKEFNAIAKEPEAIPDSQYDEVAQGFQAVIEKYPDSQLTPILSTTLGRLYAVKKDYAAAREQFDLVIRKYPDNKGLGANALFLIGKTYEVNGDWPKAYEVYKRLMEEYPTTTKAMDVPLYVAHYYKEEKEQESALLAYDLAVNYYRRIAGENEGNPMGFNALRYLSNCYLEQGRWQQSINTLGEILEDYGLSGYLSPKDAQITVKTINVLAAYQLKDQKIAVELYEGIIKRNPEHPMKAYLEKVIEAFKTLEEKGVRVLQKE